MIRNCCSCKTSVRTHKRRAGGDDVIHGSCWKSRWIISGVTDEQFAKITPHLPTDTRGKERVDDRRVISGIVHVLKSGGRWTDAPRENYGPKKTL